MEKEQLRIPWIPVIGALIILFFYWIELDPLAAKASLQPCDTFQSKSCTGTSALADNTPPEINGVSPVDGSYEIGPDPTAIFSICDFDSGINVSSLQGSVYYPSIDYYPYDIDEEENLTITSTTAGCYDVELSHSEEIPEGNSATWWITACDCVGNRSEAEISAVNATWLTYNFWEFMYIVQYAIWYLAIFGPQLFPRSWGIAYDTRSKRPLSRAVIRLYSSDGELVDSAVTDVYGVFVFKPDPGTYTVHAQAGGYTFPSALAPLKADGRRKNLYYGDEIEITTAGEPLRICIPLDPIDTTPPDLGKRLASSALYTLNSMNTWLLFLTGVIVPLIWIEPPWTVHTLIYSGVNLSLLGLQFIFERKARGRVGSVKDEEGKPLEEVEIGLYDSTYDKLIDKKTTDKRGRYQFVAPGGRYYIKPTGVNYVLADETTEKGIVVEKETDQDILIAPDIKVRRTK